MKKICLISDKNIYMKRICNFLTENGFKVYLICRHKKGLSEKEFNNNIQFYQLSSTFFISKYKEIHGIIEHIKPDIVHLHYIAKDSLIPALKINKKDIWIFNVSS